MLIPKLETERFVLRNLIPDQDGFENYLSWMRNEVSNPFIEGVSEQTTLQDLQEYTKLKNESPKAILLGIFVKNKPIHIGNLKLEPLIRGSDTTLGILIGEESWRGKGVGHEVLQKIIEFSFNELGLSQIRLGVDKRNIPAYKLYLKLGFISIDDETKKSLGTSMILRRIQ